MFKRSLLGYRRADVDTAIATRESALDDAGQRLVSARKLIDRREQVIVEQRIVLESAQSRIADLERVATKLSERVVERERELKLMRAELSELRSSSDQGMKALVAVAAELDAIRGQARGQATRIRLQALSEAAELSDKLTAIAQRPVEVRERLVAALDEALGQAAPEPQVDELFEPVPATPDPISELAAEVEAVVGETEPIVIAAPNGDVAEAESEGDVRQLVHPGDLFAGRIEVEIGPLDDFAQLVGFEDAASGIAGASEISVKRFAKGRATLEMRIDAPIELLRELEGRSPFEFKVRDTRDDRVVLDLDAE